MSKTGSIIAAWDAHFCLLVMCIVLFLYKMVESETQWIAPLVMDKLYTNKLRSVNGL